MARILLVDDDAKIRLFMRRVLDREGHLVVEAEDGDRAMTLARATPYDVVITDILMPNTDGIELLQELLALTPRPGIIAISGGLAAWSPLPSAELLGASETLAKPFTAVELIAAVTRSLAGNVHS